MAMEFIDWGLALTPLGEAFMKESLSLKVLDDVLIRRYLLNSDFRTIPSDCFGDIRIPDRSGLSLIFQVVKAVDISKPLGPEEEAEDETVDEEGSRKAFKGSKRTLKITLVSPGGILRIDALEIVRLAALTESCVPGTKILIKGPVNVSSGFLLLESENTIKVLGGSVKKLVDGYKLNEEVKQRRRDMVSAGDQVGGPPKFISFLQLNKKDIKKRPDPIEPPPRLAAPIESTSRAVDDKAEVSEKIKELQESKLASDAFAMKAKGKGGKGRRVSSRRERDELIDQYKPPSRSAPQLSAFVRLDKVSNLEDAQRLHDAFEKHVHVPVRREGHIEEHVQVPVKREGQGKGFGKGQGKGFEKAQGKGIGKGCGKGTAKGQGKGKGKGGGKGRGKEN